MELGKGDVVSGGGKEKDLESVRRHKRDFFVKRFFGWGRGRRNIWIE